LRMIERYLGHAEVRARDNNHFHLL
jgi:hypothetical protein